MKILYIIIGAFVGMVVGQNGLGAVSGAAIGYLLGEIVRLKVREKNTIEKVKDLVDKLNTLQASSNSNVQEKVSSRRSTVR